MNGRGLISRISGFTLIELLVIMGIMAILAVSVGVVLIRPQGRASLDSTVGTFVADLRQQQLKSMVGESNGTSAQAFGIRVEPTQYVLFRGTTYNAGDSANVIIPLGDGVTATSNLPNNQVVFERLSGEVSAYASASATITIQHTSGVAKTLTLNRLGVVNVQ